MVFASCVVPALLPICFVSLDRAARRYANIFDVCANFFFFLSSVAFVAFDCGLAAAVHSIVSSIRFLIRFPLLLPDSAFIFIRRMVVCRFQIR